MGCVIAAEVCSSGKERKERTKTPQVAGSEGFLVFGGLEGGVFFGRFDIGM
jgi:hypothetical protein